MFICRENSIINTFNLKQSELILNADGSVYHLALKPNEIAQKIITVGDPKRVFDVSSFFDKIELKKENREFVTHTGVFNNQTITCLSTGMGTDNIDIVMNELDALVNIDLNSRKINQNLTSLNIVRLGTSGSILPTIDVDSVLYTKIAIGLEGLLNWYKTEIKSNTISKWEAAFQHIDLPVKPTFFEAHQTLEELFNGSFAPGITVTTPGFYAPQNRQLRLKPSLDIFAELEKITVDGKRITNVEMETAGIYGLAQLLGHKAISINVILANRATGVFSKNPQQIMQKTIQKTLELLCK